jgi:hypothetical protein
MTRPRGDVVIEQESLADNKVWTVFNVREWQSVRELADLTERGFFANFCQSL